MARSRPSSDLTLGIAYWVIVVSLLLLGFLSIFSIGLGFLLMAAAMIVLSPFRSKPQVWWSGMAGVVGFLIGYVVVAPFSCSQTQTFEVTGVVEESPTICRSLAGVEYTGPEPNRIPGIIGGGALGVLAASAAWMRVGKQHNEAESDLGVTNSPTDPAQ